MMMTITTTTVWVVWELVLPSVRSFLFLRVLSSPSTDSPPSPPPLSLFAPPSPSHSFVVDLGVVEESRHANTGHWRDPCATHQSRPHPTSVVIPGRPPPQQQPPCRWWRYDHHSWLSVFSLLVVCFTCACAVCWCDDRLLWLSLFGERYK